MITLFVAPAGAAPGLRLRPWNDDDIPALVAAHRDPALRNGIASVIDDEADARQRVAVWTDEWASGSRFSFAVCADEGVPIGYVAVKGLASGKDSAEVGYWTAVQARGQGVAPRALEAVSQWVFALPRDTPLERLELLHSVGNPASCRVAEKTQFVLDSVLAPFLPAFPAEGHLHIRRTGQQLRPYR